jgi:hypothetical protein
VIKKEKKIFSKAESIYGHAFSYIFNISEGHAD